MGQWSVSSLNSWPSSRGGKNKGGSGAVTGLTRNHRYWALGLAWFLAGLSLALNGLLQLLDLQSYLLQNSL